MPTPGSVDEESIETQVQSLRLRLSAQSTSTSSSAHQSKQDIRNLKSHDSHALAQAKQVEMNRMGRAFGIGSGYVEGKAFDRAGLEVERAERAAKREEAERQRVEMVARREREREERDAAFKESEKKRRREEYYA